MSKDGTEIEKLHHGGDAAWERIKNTSTKQWADWLQVGASMRQGRDEAIRLSRSNGPAGSAYNKLFGAFLEKRKYRKMSKPDRHYLMKVMEYEADIIAWRNREISDAGPDANVRLNHPQIVFQKWWSDVGKARYGKGGDAVEREPTIRDSVVSLEEQLADAKALIEELEAARAPASDAPVNVTYPEEPVDPDEPDGPKEPWTETVEANGPALIGVVRALAQSLAPNAEFSSVITEPGHNKYRHWDRLRFEVRDGEGYPGALKQRLFTDWLSPEILAIWGMDASKVTIEFEITARVEKAEFKAMAPIVKKKEAARHKREQEIWHALIAAAEKVHPGYRKDDDDADYFEKIDENAPEDHDLITWFKTTHPDKARRIEEALKDG